MSRLRFFAALWIADRDNRNTLAIAALLCGFALAAKAGWLVFGGAA